MRSRLFLAVIVAALSLPCFSQSVPRADVAVSYSYLRAENYDSQAENYNGVSGSADYNFSRWVALSADVGVVHENSLGVASTVSTYALGPRFFYRKTSRVVPYLNTLVGLGRNGETVSGSALATHAFVVNAGGGVDIGLDSKARFALRPEVAYLLFLSNPPPGTSPGISSSNSSVRVSIGLVYNIGHKQ
jgi:hypothetical protein